jgi:ABC-type dipeptide/oligopeptide/nickel transport system ATPase subunit
LRYILPLLDHNRTISDMDVKQLPAPDLIPSGDPAREAIDALRGYVYQIYQSALAWTELKSNEFLFLEVAEDFAIVASTALEAVQVKETNALVTINSDDIIASIDSFVELQKKNPTLNVSLRHLTTSQIGKEKSLEHRVGEMPTLIAWRNLAKVGDVSDLRKILDNSKLSPKSKQFIADLNDIDFRENFLKRIHFDCGAPNSHFLSRQLKTKVSELVIERGGVYSQASSCLAKILLDLLKLSTNKNREERCVDRSGLEAHLEAATQITINKAQFEEQNRLLAKALLSISPSGSALSNSLIANPSPVSHALLPKALVNRGETVAQLQRSLECAGICWITGAAGMGKTVAARVLANMNGGNWASINLRSQSTEQVAQVLSHAANALPTYGLRGLIIDDFDCALDPPVLDSIHYLFHSAARTDVLLVVNSSNPPTSEFLFASDLHADIAVTLTEFTEENIAEILGKFGVNNTSWVKYTHLVSGGGHPQLAIAFIQSMASAGWNPEELQTMNALLTGSSAVNEVRKRTRERLLRELPEANRRLIERLSLKVGGFSRELAVELGKVAPSIQDTGIVLDSLTGSWIDQHEGDRFSLSPLLSDYAAKTLTTDEKTTIESAIAESLTKGRILDLTEMNSAFLAAWRSRNKAVIYKLCMAVFGTDHDKLDMLAPHLSIVTLFRTDTIAYQSDAAISHMFRGVQLLLLNQTCGASSKLEDAMRCFSEEATNVQDNTMRTLTNMLVYFKLLLSTSKAGLGANFVSVIQDLDRIVENKNNVLPAERLEALRSSQEEGISLIGFLFINQACKLTKIDDLPTVFDFIESSSPELRSRLLAPFTRDDFDVDMLVTGAWLSEDKNNTIDPPVHSAIFSRLEKQAIGWNHTDLAVCCRKFQAMILDEYGNDKKCALAVLEEGLTKYGKTNSELVRAKAKVLYRSDDHEGSLALSKTLIESDAPLSEVEKAFLGRDAAISAEKQGDFETARRYYLYGSDAANKSQHPNMAAMRVGLLADAALASWHSGDKLTCVQDFVVVLSKLNQFAPDETLRTAHCHAATRHVLLWMDKDVTGDVLLIENDDEIKIYPGCVSNPEPHSDIGEHYITPIEMAWYMLATVENHASLDAGITENLERFLPHGPVLEGQMLLSSAKIHKAMTRLDANLFVDALKDEISYFAYVKASGMQSGGLDIKNVTYGTFPLATKEQQEECREITENFVILYCAMCILKEDIKSITEVLRELTVSSCFAVRPELLDRLQTRGSFSDFNTSFAQLILAHSSSLSSSSKVSPIQVFELAFKVLQIAQAMGTYRLFSESMLPWLEKKWEFIQQNQRFLLSHPLLYEAKIDATIEKKNILAHVKIIDLLRAILPLLGIRNQKEIEKNLIALQE